MTTQEAFKELLDDRVFKDSLNLSVWKNYRNRPVSKSRMTHFLVMNEYKFTTNEGNLVWESKENTG